MTDHDVPANVRLVGGEMPSWSDLDSPWPAPSAGAQLPVVTAALDGRSRVLLAGPHQPDVVRAVLDVAGQVTCLVRSIPDARRLAEDFEGDKLDVVCGSLERCPADGYDAVVALDDVLRVYSTEGPEPVFANAVADLRRLLAADGVLVLAVENELGVHRLSGWTQPETDDSDAAWTPPVSDDPTRPRTAAELVDRSGGSGTVWPLSPHPVAPVVLWGPALATVDRTAYTGLHAAIAELAAAALPAGPTVTDPGLLLRRAWRSGLVGELAAGWLVVSDPAAGGADLLAHLPGGRLLAGADGIVSYDGPAGAQVVPAGELVSDLLLRAALLPDQARLRSELTSYAEWLAEHPSAAADRVVRAEDGTYAELPAFAPGEGQSLLGTAAALVARVERYGYRRTWPSYLAPAEAVGWVVAMRGTPADEGAVRAAAEAHGLTPVEPADVPLDEAPVAQRLRERADRNVSRARWLEDKLKTAEKQLASLRQKSGSTAELDTLRKDKARLQKDLAKLRSSRTMKIGRAVLSPAKAARRMLKRT